MAHIPSQEPAGIARTTSKVDSRVEMQQVHQVTEGPLYGDLQKYLAQQRKYWLLARDVELARPLQTRYSAYEAEIMSEIWSTEDERVRTYNQRWRDMRGATGPTKISWKLYKLKVALCARWDHYQLHCRWKHGQLNAKKKELIDEYVRAQRARRITLLKEIVCFGDEQSVEGRDDGGYVRDGMLNYIMTGYDSLFPISRNLELETENPWKEKRGWKTLNPFTLWEDAPKFGWGL